VPDGPRGGAAYGRLNAAQRLLQDRLAGACLPTELAESVTAELNAISALLSDHQVPEQGRCDGMRTDLAGRGHPLLPPYVIDEEATGSVRGRVTFTRFYLGGNGAVHGGCQPLLFDDIFGRAANNHRSGIARTAFLKVNYRRVTPIDVELRYEASLDSIDGRKRWLTGRLFGPGGELLSDADALFLQLLEGQQ
jgi:acyl-coenzyme A thioesterase PaaI-like protein